MTRVLLSHQKDGLALTRRAGGRAGLLMRPGVGKTLTAIRYIEQGWLVLIICRRDDVFTWCSELKADGYSDDQIFPVGKKVDLADLFGRFVHDGNGHTKVVITTFDRLRDEYFEKSLKGSMWDLAIVDEAWMIANMKAERTRATHRVLKDIPHKLVLNGTAIGNHIEDLFSQVKLLGYDVLGKSEWDFKKKFYLKEGFRWYLKRGAKQQIIDLIKPFCFFVHEDDVLKGLPKKMYIRKSCGMNDKQQTMYNQLLNDWEVSLSNGETIETNHVVHRLTKMKQAANGVMHDERLPNPKMDLLMDMLTDKKILGEKKKVVIWSAFTEQVRWICDEAATRGIKAVAFYGSHRQTKFDARVSFRDDPSVRLFVGQADSGVGMNELIVADTAVYMSNSARVRSRTQSEARIRRQGSQIHKRVTYYDLIVEGTIEEQAFDDLERGVNFADSIVNALKQGKSLRTILT